MNNTEIAMAIHKQLKDNLGILIDLKFNKGMYRPSDSLYFTQSSYLWLNLNKALQPVRISIRFSALPPYN